MAYHDARPPGRLAGLLRSHRLAAALTQRQLASQAGISVGTLRDLEQGRTARPRPPSLVRLATALRLTGSQQAELLSASADPPGGRPADPPAARRAGQGGGGLRVGVLGPLTVWRDGLPARLGPVRQRAVLGLLAVHADAGLHRAAIIDALWPADPPPTATAMVQAQVSRIRRLLASGQDGAGSQVSWDGAAYRLRLDGSQLDLAEFSSLSDQASQAAVAGDAAAACEQYEQALALWRGQALSGLDLLRGHPAVIGLDRRRAEVVIEYAAVASRSGRPGRALPQLEALADRDPLDERAGARLMLALAATGRQAAALRRYQYLAARLDSELGVRPGQELAAAHLQVLRQDGPALAAAAAAAATPSRPATPAPPAQPARPAQPDPVVPRQLPSAVPRFSGRVAELTALTRLLDHADDSGSTTVVIAGTAGVGKTALAVCWARQVASRFPDGQLHISLRGFGPARLATAPAAALRQFLDGLGVPARRIPADLDAQAALYRSLLAGRRMLIVLDNARDPAQVRPLLPGSPGCQVLITSRDQLLGLAASDGAHLIALDVLTEPEARGLLAGRLGQARVAAEPDATRELIRLTARLPLALSIVAARAAASPDRPLAALAAGLSAARTPLDELATGDADTDVRLAFSWSCQQLSEPAWRMFRLIGQHGGPDITVPAAASLAGVPAGPARQALAELARLHLITEAAPGRYGCHDLLRAYAAEQSAGQDSEASQRDALRRVLDHYLHTASAAALLLHPDRSPVTLDVPRPGAQPEELAGRPQALAWLQAERQVLLAAISQAAAAGFSVHAWQLPWAVATFFNWQGHWHDLLTTQQNALAAARQAGDCDGQVHALHYLAQARMRLRAYEQASADLTDALELGRQLGSDVIMARAHIDLGHLCELEGRSSDALGHAEQAARLYRAAGHRFGEADALNAAGWCHAQLGAYQQALDHCARALAIYRELGNGPAEAATLDSLGYAHHQLGRYQQAISCYRQAMTVHGEAGDLHLRAEMLAHLGDSHQASGDGTAGRLAWQQALAILDDLGHPDARQVRSRLDSQLAGHGSAPGAAALTASPAS